MTFQPRFDFDAVRTTPAPEIEADEALHLELDGWEGPLHLLLELARRQKIDLLQISVARLAEQYLLFVREAKRRRFALAADYLVMASWLAFLKSRLLLPRPERALPEELPAEEAAATLAFRLAKLDAMRTAAEALGARPRDGLQVFGRGGAEAVGVRPPVRGEGDLHALVTAYVAGRRRETVGGYAPRRRAEAYPLEAARARLQALLPELADWATLSAIAPTGADGPPRASRLASTLAAGLELVRDGALDVRQAEREVLLRARAPAAA